MLEAIFVLTLISLLASLAQTLLQWWMLRELGGLDKDRKDWWERAEDSAQYRGVVRWLKFLTARPSKK